MSSSKTIVVGSRNPVKISATLRGFELAFPERTFQVEGIATDSGVSDQPMSEEETLLGATNRAEAVLASSACDFAAGIEGGIVTIQDQFFAAAWVVILDRDRNKAQARSGCFALPPKVKQLVESGLELGSANDQVFNEVNSKHAGGAVGSLTKGLISRQQLYEHAVVLALASYVQPELYR
ncbi:MAG: inosine/xanthosine triphosphatase [Pirellulaceae bacterium]